MTLPIIREVTDPAAPAIAYTENGKTIVEVDEQLKGKERSTAIMAALRAHDDSLGGLILIPLLVYVVEPLTRWTRDHTPTVIATAGVAGAISATTLVPWLLADDDQSPVAGPVSTLIATPALPAPTSGVILPSPEPTVEAKPSARPSPMRTAPPTRPPTNSPTVRVKTPTPRPSGTRPPTRRPDLTPTPTGAAPPSSPAPAGVAPKSPGPTASPSPTSRPTVSPTPQPTLTTAADNCLLELDLDPLLGVCLLG